MEGKRLTNLETRVTEVISFILEQYRNEKVNQDMEVCSELILIARILHQRFKISNGTQVKEDKSVQVAKNEVLKEIKDDEYYILSGNEKKTISNVWHVISELLGGLSIVYNDKKLNPMEMRNYIGNCNKFHNMTGWTPKFDIRMGISETIKNFNKLRDV